MITNAYEMLATYYVYYIKTFLSYVTLVRSLILFALKSWMYGEVDIATRMSSSAARRERTFLFIATKLEKPDSHR